MTDVRVERRWIGYVVTVLAVATVAALSVTAIDQREKAECLAENNGQLTNVLRARGDAFDADRQATLRFANAIVKHPSQAGQALTDYRDTLAATEKYRKQHPYPPLPDDDCG